MQRARARVILSCPIDGCGSDSSVARSPPPAAPDQHRHGSALFNCVQCKSASNKLYNVHKEILSGSRNEIIPFALSFPFFAFRFLYFSLIYAVNVDGDGNTAPSRDAMWVSLGVRRRSAHLAPSLSSLLAPARQSA